MIALAGSVLVRDSESIRDLDVVYLTLDIGRYILLLRLRASIEDMLRKKLGKNVTFSPYPVLSPTLIGNLFLAITMLRYPHRRVPRNYLMKLILAKLDARWLILHLAFAVLGVISSKNHRDCRKYCSMLAENLLYRYKIKIPNTWNQTIKLGYALSSHLGLRYTYMFFKSCLKCIHGKHSFLSKEMLSDVVQEYTDKVIKKENTTVIVSGLSNALRRIHEIITALLFKKKVMWVKCSSMLLTMVTPEVLNKLLADEYIRELAISLFNACRNEIPVLSPLAHP